MRLRRAARATRYSLKRQGAAHVHETNSPRQSVVFSHAWLLHLCAVLLFTAQSMVNKV